MTSKIKIKMGAIEIEYEGSEDFLKEELPELLSAVSNLYQKSANVLKTEESSTVQATNTDIKGTTSTLAAKLGGGTGADLCMAAIARVTFVLNKETCTRKELLDEMKSAKAYYKANYSSNLTKIINKLVKDGKLMEPSAGSYSLSAENRTGIGAQLA
ncbi:MAG: hypothetical protein COA63_008270 [Methylophaga sp.]|nr:hypothetical protein [Methylophaga sp.]